MAHTVQQYIESAQRALAAGFTTKTAQQDAMAALNNAYDQLRKEITDACLRTERDASGNMSPKFEAVYWDLPHYPHQWKPKHATLVGEAFGGGGLYDEVVPQIEAVAALRATIKAAPVIKSTAPTKQQLEDAAKMTCQCCGRAICANTGLIAHHGYERPGWGWQTASCEGARELPFEASRDALGAYINRLQARRLMLQGSLARVNQLRERLTMGLTNYDEHRTPGKPHNMVTLTMSAETFDEQAAAYPKTMRYSGLATWEQFKAAYTRQLQAQLDGVEHELQAQQLRYNGWTQTHTWNAVTAQFEEIK